MSWSEVGAQAPELAERVMAALAAHRHKVLATLRADGSPRVSGSELDLHAGELYVGSMPGARKALDLQRDPRYALHSAPVDVDLAVPDVKLAGTAVEVTAPAEVEAFVAARSAPVPPGPFHLFRLEVTEVVCTWVEDGALHIESWHAGRGVEHTTR